VVTDEEKAAAVAKVAEIEVSKAEREKLKAEKEEHMAELERKKRERAARFGTGPSTEVVAQEEER
jgi:hypothetical protein